MICLRRRNQNFMMGRESQMFNSFRFLTVLCTVAALFVGRPVLGQLSTNFYSSSCPSVLSTVRSGLNSAVASDARIPASLLRLFFHDCFVQGNGCDGSVLLDDTPTQRGEKSAGPNANSLRGFNVINNIKATLETTCPGVVSCADILAIVARDSVVVGGGPTWNVELGRRDSRTANFNGANALPNPGSSAAQLINLFGSRGFNPTDLVALSGAHSFGRTQCSFFQNRLVQPDPTMDATLVATLRAACSSGTTVVNLDQSTATVFDNQYYNNLVLRRGIFTSDQSLANFAQTASIVNNFRGNQGAFFNSFAAAMIKLGRVGVLTGNQGEIRRRCNIVN